MPWSPFLHRVLMQLIVPYANGVAGHGTSGWSFRSIMNFAADQEKNILQVTESTCRMLNLLFGTV
jgi:hypothetical protein